MLRGLQHFGLTVRDVDASAVWYEEVPSDAVPCQFGPFALGRSGPIPLPPRCHGDQKGLTAFRRSGL
jgi:hypothetical protein